MAYFDEYGQDDARRERFFKILVAALLISIALGFLYYVFFRNWREEWQARRFLYALQAGEYENAYQYWGCSIEEPCRFYPYDEFLEDWGPESPLGKVEDFSLGHSYTQRSGVIIALEINGQVHPNLWVDRETKAVGFYPY